MTKDVREKQHDIDKLNRLVEGIRVAMLATIDVDGSVRSRPMATHPIDAGGKLWFLTNASSHKIDEVHGHEQVGVAYTNPDGQRYVSLSGRASLVRDARKLDELWSPAYTTWFPNGKNDPDLALLCVEIQKAEYWDTPLRTMVVLFEYARTMLTGKPFEPSHHEQIDLGGTSDRS